MTVVVVKYGRDTVTDDNEYKCTYTFQCEYENVDLPDEPTHSLTHIVFDGTDAHINVVVKQFETFLKAAGYNFDYLEVIKK
jgi:hypothetical protein